MVTRLPGLARLQDIGAAFYSGVCSRDEARAAVIDVISGQLQCSRVSLWRFDGTPGALRLLCLASKVTGGALVTSERSLLEAEYRDYFDALVRTGMYVGVDTMHDPHLQPVRELPVAERRAIDARRCVHRQRARVRHGVLRADRPLARMAGRRNPRPARARREAGLADGRGRRRSVVGLAFSADGADLAQAARALRAGENLTVPDVLALACLVSTMSCDS